MKKVFLTDDEFYKAIEELDKKAIIEESKTEWEETHLTER